MKRVDQEERRARYAELRSGWRPSPTIYRELVAERLTPEARVLDVGCGRSELLSDELARARRAVGIDPDVASLAKNDVLAHRIAATAERLPFDRASFDLVTMAWVVEHLERPVRVSREINRVLDAGGRVAFVTPNAWNYNAWLIRAVPNALHPVLTWRLYGREAGDTFPTRYRLNTPGLIDRTLRRIGFVPERVVLNGDPTYIAVTEPLFRLALMLERLYDLPILRRARVHLLGVYRKV